MDCRLTRPLQVGEFATSPQDLSGRNFRMGKNVVANRSESAKAQHRPSGHSSSGQSRSDSRLQSHPRPGHSRGRDAWPARGERRPWVAGLLLSVVIAETLLSAWGFVNIGSGSNLDVAMPRYGYGGAELLSILAACTAAFAWLTLKWKRHGFQGLYIVLGLDLLWALSMGFPPGDYAAREPEQTTLAYLVIAFTVTVAALLWLGLAHLWRQFETS